MIPLFILIPVSYHPKEDHAAHLCEMYIVLLRELIKKNENIQNCITYYQGCMNILNMFVKQAVPGATEDEIRLVAYGAKLQNANHLMRNNFAIDRQPLSEGIKNGEKYHFISEQLTPEMLSTVVMGCDCSNEQYEEIKNLLQLNNYGDTELNKFEAINLPAQQKIALINDIC